MRFAAIAGVVSLLAASACSTRYVPRGPGVAVTMQRGKVVYVRDGQRFEHGFLGSGLVQAVSPNPKARAAAEKYRSQMKKGLLVLVTGLVCGSVALGFAIEKEDEAFLGASLLCYAGGYAGIFFFADAETHRLDAINIFNDGALEGPPGDPWAPPGQQRRGYSLQMRE